MCLCVFMCLFFLCFLFAFFLAVLLSFSLVLSLSLKHTYSLTRVRFTPLLSFSSNGYCYFSVTTLLFLYFYVSSLALARAPKINNMSDFCLLLCLNFFACFLVCS
uniref:(northern house mosquito) hypothetical protein n=1 Tax=Culex pipiens TaxID=7175 RepID=A0A8D8EYW4_CULPI